MDQYKRLPRDLKLSRRKIHVLESKHHSEEYSEVNQISVFFSLEEGVESQNP